MSLQNPYNNVGEYPPEPFGSVVDAPSLTETAGLDVYNFLDYIKSNCEYKPYVYKNK